MATATKRVSKKVIQNVSSSQFNDAMASYAANDARSAKIRATIDVEITKVREKYADDLEEIADELEKNQEIIEVYCMENKDTLFSKKKSMDTSHGTVGYRTGTPKLKLLKGFNWNKVLDNLKAYLPSYVRTTEEPAKDRLLSDRENEEVAENLKKVGIEVVQDESFFIELKKEELPVA